MKRVIAMFLGAVVFAVGITTGPPATSAQTKPAEHRYQVGKLNNMWKVYDPANPKIRVITAKRGDRVIWVASGSDIFLNFSNEAIFGVGEASAANGKELALTVSANAKPGRYTYSIFCAKDRTYATGDSPPIIIIQ